MEAATCGAGAFGGLALWGGGILPASLAKIPAARLAAIQHRGEHGQQRGQASRSGLGYPGIT